MYYATDDDKSNHLYYICIWFYFLSLATMPTIKTGNKIIMETTIKSILYIFIMSISLIGIVISALLTESMPLMIFILIELITISFYYSPTNNN